MRHYECVYILDPALAEDEQGALTERFRQIVTAQGGAVEHHEKWERRRLAYEIKGKREGVYYILNFSAEPGAEAELNRVLRLTDGVLRHQVVRLDDLALRYMQSQAAQRAQAAAQAQAQAAARTEEAAPAAAVVEAQAEAAGDTLPPSEEQPSPPAEPETSETPTTEPVTDEATTEDEDAASEATETDED